MKKKRKDAHSKTWQWTDQELQQSLDLWADLDHLKGSKSPEEKMLEELRKLLGNLKEEIHQFDN